MPAHRALANGNLLVEGLPGLAKTRAIKSLAKNMDAGLSRIQFTPDLLPADITGTEIYYAAEGKGEFRFQAGPIFNFYHKVAETRRAVLRKRDRGKSRATQSLPELNPR